MEGFGYYLDVFCFSKMRKNNNNKNEETKENVIENGVNKKSEGKESHWSNVNLQTFGGLPILKTMN